MSLESVLDVDIEDFGFGIERSVLKAYPEPQWRAFIESNPFQEADGLYVPSTFTAYVNADAPHVVPTALHELYGHGLFTEHAHPIGFTKYDEEGFALWTEDRLSERIGYREVFEDKLRSLPSDHQRLHEHYRALEERWTRLGFFAQLGFPKRYDEHDVRELTYRTHPEADIVILYGSRKPRSDIDLFVVGERTGNYHNGWLDVYEVDRSTFRHWLGRFDVSVTDPLFTGTLIRGDPAEIERLKQDVLEAPITPEAIEHNLAEAQRLKSHHALNEHEEQMRKRYEESHTLLARALSGSRKLLTYRELLATR